MPETDWLTGLSSRLAFAHQVNQADRDRDQFAVAILAVDDFAEVNRQLGYHVGDDLLRAIGHALSLQTSVNMVAARLDGTQFGLLGLHVSNDDIQRWIGPIVAAARAAVDGWAAEQIDFTGDCAVEPDLVVGAASGFSSDVWGNAAVAVEVAATDASRWQVVRFDTEDPRFVALDRRQQLRDRITTALDAGDLVLAADGVEPVSGGQTTVQWLRLAAYLESGDDPTFAGVIDSARLPGGLGRRLEHWLIAEAGRLIRSVAGPMRLTVPLGGEARAGRSLAERLLPLLEEHRIAPSRLLFEVSERTLTEAGSRGWNLARQLDGLGAGVVLTGYEGGWQTWRATEGLPIAYVRPDLELVTEAASGNGPGTRILSTIAGNARHGQRELIAPSSMIAGPVLADLGFSYTERPSTASGENLGPVEGTDIAP